MPSSAIDAARPHFDRDYDGGVAITRWRAAYPQQVRGEMPVEGEAPWQMSAIWGYLALQGSTR